VRSFILALAGAAVAIAFARSLPAWSLYLLTIAFAKSLVVLGLVFLFRCGLVSFGHGLYYCVGAYVPGLLGHGAGWTNAFASVALGGLATLALGAALGLFLARYRGVFFAMFNLALSMMLYGVLLKSQTLGGSDGIRVPNPTGLDLAGADNTTRVFTLCVVVVALACAFASTFFRSEIGLRSRAIRDNEIRIAFLGGAASRTVLANYACSAGLTGIGGVLTALASGYVTPDLAYWTTSGEFVFMIVLCGVSNVAAVPLTTLLFEAVRLLAAQLAPHLWQMILGLFLLSTIVFLPDGLSTMLRRRPLSGDRRAA